VLSESIDPAAIDFTRAGKHHYRAAFHLDGSWGYSLVPITVFNCARDAPGAPGIAVFGGHGVDPGIRPGRASSQIGQQRSLIDVSFGTPYDRHHALSCSPAAG